MLDFKYYLLVIHFFMIMYHTPTGKKLKGSILGPLHFLFCFNDLSKTATKDANII